MKDDRVKLHRISGDEKFLKAGGVMGRFMKEEAFDLGTEGQYNLVYGEGRKEEKENEGTEATWLLQSKLAL